MRVILPMLAAAALACGCQREPLPSAAPGGEWIALFNGSDLNGWTPKFMGHPLGENIRDTFRVENGVLTVSYENHESWDELYGHLFYDVRPFSHYWIRAEYRFVGEQVPGAPDWAWRNNGLMLHAQPPATMGLNQDFPVSVEVRLLGGDSLFSQRPTANMCSIGATVLLHGRRPTDRCVESEAETFRGDQWVLVEAEVRGSEVVRHYVNGRRVMEYSDLLLNEPQPWSPTMALEAGYVGIQAESHPTEFRRIEILELNE